MRYKQGGEIQVDAIAGTRVILIALDCTKEKAAGLMGFAFKREIVGGKPEDWLKGLKVFRKLEPNPKPNSQYSTFENPIQSFLWSDYTVQPGVSYKFTIAAMYGQPGSLQQGDTITFEIKTEMYDDGNHGVWFNRGSVASQAFAREFNNAAMTDEIANDPQNKMTVWLSRGLLEAYLGFIKDTPTRGGLRVSAYEFTYQPFLKALKTALDRGVDVQIVYHDTPANAKAISTVGIPAKDGAKQILFKRTRPPIPHNKFIVRLNENSKPVSVLTGSTNFTPSGFLGQTNVGHQVTDDTTAETYLNFWTMLSKNPLHAPAVANVMRLTPNPANLPPKNSTTEVFSARSSPQMLDWYEQRIVDARTSVVFTGAFGVDAKILAGLQKNQSSVRFILLEKPPDASVRLVQKGNQADIRVSYGAVLGQTYQKSKSGSGTGKKLVPIPKFELDKWFLKEELARRDGSGFVFFIHTKFLLVDPLSDDPLVCTGSANFSKNSLTTNDENMLLIRGNERVADIYLTEFDRIFRHFYFRDVANEVALKGNKSDSVFLDDTGAWSNQYFDEEKFNYHRREMFFVDPKDSWVEKAPSDVDPFTSKQKATARKTASKRGTAKKGRKKARPGGKPAKKRPTKKTVKRKRSR
jgi:phosphatidylserine/phosphatidylglycerophosphate/cardiolipin synthase-like enzyme